MGIDYYHCDKCDETYPDCGDVHVKSCVNDHSICSICMDKQLEKVPCVYYVNGEPGIENEDEQIHEEFCPICNDVETETLPEFEVHFGQDYVGIYRAKTEFNAKWDARKSLLKSIGNLELYTAVKK